MDMKRMKTTDDTGTAESNTNKVPLLLRSGQWNVTEKTENQISAVRIRNEQNEKLIQQGSLIHTLHQTIDQQNQMIELQNKKIDDLNRQVQKLLHTRPLTEKKSRTSSAVHHMPVLMSDSVSGPDAAVFGSQVRRDRIDAVYTLNTLKNAPSSAWDVSAEKNGSVKAWITTSSDSEKQTSLYLAADGDIYANRDSSYLFADYTRLRTADLSHIKISLVTSMKGMFCHCSNLSELNIDLFHTSSVQEFTSMFYECKKLKNLDVSNWNTSQAISMYAMFYACESLETLNVSHWDTSHVTRTEHMFRDCIHLKKLDVSRWDTSHIQSFECMFSHCKSLTSLDVSHWNTENVTNMSFMFNECSNLRRLDTRTWNTASVTNMYAMFSLCSSLNILTVSQWDVSNVTDMNYMFHGCLIVNQLNKGALSSWKLNPSVIMNHICAGTKFEKNPMDLFQA